jgi:hypothetical protein
MSDSGFTTPVRSRSPVGLRIPPNAPMVNPVDRRRTLNDDSTRGISRTEDIAFGELVARLRAPLLTPPRIERSVSPPGGSPGDVSIAFPVLLDLPVAVTPPHVVHHRTYTPSPVVRRGVVRPHSEIETGDESDEDMFFATPPPKRFRPSGDE